MFRRPLAVGTMSLSLLLLLLLLSLALLQPSRAWVVPSRARLPSTTRLYDSDVQDISLEGLSDDHEVEGERMAQSIAAWLDAEWMPQEIHARMGESAKRSYVACRASGDNEIMSIMMRVASDLDADWQKEYDADAFVNAWDVANYVSDYLTQQAGNESCECSTPVY